ncbi:helix-turn-helix domain-containing protein [Bradyrhizobium australafricanum]|uniref:helix-turn-helix domain-containing protein n=1 Tax=Bradyrhizobium australafricanum TaxID=2821406 RepID=UPI001CE366DE|nr:helix-turn-helix domain-containing protein [Bradyrhizobium australafricanum]
MTDQPQAKATSRITKRDAPLRLAAEKLALTVPEVAALTSLGQTSVYKAIREGRLRIRKYGTRTIITRADLASFLENLPDGRDGFEA